MIGVGVGTAAATALDPAFELQRQEAWKESQARILELGQLAELVAQGLQAVDDVLDRAQRNGYSRSELLAAIQLGLKAPPYSEVLDLWRRNATRPASEQITEAQVDHALAKAGIEYQFWPALKELINARLSAPDLALAIVRGLIPDPGILPVAPPTTAGKIPSFPVFDVDALKEALATGYDKERLSVLVGTMGRPMPVDQAARATFRDIIDRVDFDRAIAEGDIRNEWRDPLFEVARQIPTAHDGIEGHLRGWIDEEAMYAQTARHGMSREDTDLLFKILGRPISVHQVTTGLARGGTFGGFYEGVPQPFLSALQQSNVRPEWGNLDYANRYSYPSAFFFRLLQTTGALTPAEAEQRYLELGWPPDLAKQIAEALGKQRGATAREATAADLLVLWDGGKATRDETLAALEALGYPADEATRKMDVLEARRVSAAKTTVIGDLHTKYKKGELATTTTVTALEALGMSPSAAVEIEQTWRVFLTAEGGAPPAA